MYIFVNNHLENAFSRALTNAEEVYWVIYVQFTLVHYCSLQANNPRFELYHHEVPDLQLMSFIFIICMLNTNY